MKPMALVAWGFVVVVLDFRIDHLDLVNDLVGWSMCLVGLLRVLPLSEWFRLAVAGCLAGLVAAGADLLNPPNGWLVTTIGGLAATALVFGTCTGIMVVLRDDPRARTANLIRWLDLALLPIILLVGRWIADADESGTDALVLLLVVAGLGIAIWFMVFTNSVRDAVDPDPVPLG